MREDATRLIERYVRGLDDCRYDEWLALFADDAYYGVITRNDYEKGTNYVLVGERKPKLAERVAAGAELDEHRKLHLLTAVDATENGNGVGAVSNFALLRNGVLSFSGRYYMDLARENGELKITRCMVVLDNDPIAETIYLPI